MKDIGKMRDQERIALFDDVIKFLNNLYPWDNFDEDERDGLVDRIISYQDEMTK